MNAKTRAHDLGKSDGGGKKEGRPSSPQFPLVLFSFSRFLNVAPRLSRSLEQATNEIKHFIPKIKIKRQESKMKSLSL